MRTAAWSFLGVGLVVALASAQEGSTPAPPLPLVLSRAATYVETFADTLSGLVAAESYVQDVHPAFNRFGTMPRFAKPYSGAMHRELKSDLLLVRPVGSEGWMQFRDVTEVDGKKLKDRNDRLARLFLDPSKSTASQSRKIMDESSRYNIGDVIRTINNPVIALAFLERSYQKRFAFTLGKADPSLGPSAWAIEYKEVQRPTLIRGDGDSNLPTYGRAWVDLETGRVLKTEFVIEAPAITARVTATFKPDQRLGINVPAEMIEEYKPSAGGRISGRASYGRFRQFAVKTDEVIEKPTAR